MTMTDTAAMLVIVKQDMGITGTAFDNRLTNCINEVVRFMKSSGVTEEKINSSVGVVSRGASDLFFKLPDYSPIFYNLLFQLKKECEAGNVQT